MSATALRAVRFGLVELKLLFRRPMTAMTTVLVPLALGIVTWISAPDTADPSWGAIIGDRILMLLVLAGYLVSTTVVTARRQALVLKRLRTSELSDAGVILGVLMPTAAVALGQVAVLLALFALAGAPAPEQPLLVAAGLLLAIGVTMLAGLATANLTRTVELMQLTSGPLLIAAFAGMFLRMHPDPDLALVGLAMPVVGPAELIAMGWAGESLVTAPANLPPVGLLALASTALWVVLMAALIRKSFRWEPRS
ncbi:hypothetical protein [Actinoalloteichus hymeniacidonis]|uniref:ABC-2 family transporter protein n=1 Tax=Actinoalloteichus hymeniacidonis TaxID=340345 RepID=A0AAC9HLP0_9PSEU|nr:hypothetical protein [Actinoalloteichus hymeniacidonis]AOS61419.1 hypothetical protein TL08_02925 [Actinoalloteichus hymeniacidonis]MBB5910575.1 ABC-2 type transport system permease protein [Actinoalloteichus hymeniacidonis]